MKKRQILYKFLLDFPEGIKISEIVDQFGHWYYANGAFHIGNLLSTMVKNGEAERVKIGVYKAGNGSSKISKGFVPGNQPSLF